jgi:coenzyme F420-dependent glucose-6-phosphate dehydrogenase
VVLQIGYMAPSHQLAPSELVDLAVMAEDLGLDSVFVPDQFQPWRRVGHAVAAMPWLAYVGARTSRIILGVNALAASRRRTPAVIAQEFATLGCLLPGRVVLSMGVGEGHDEVAATGHRWPAPQARLGRLEEALEIVSRLWRGDRVTFDGHYFRTKDASIHDLPETPVRLLATAHTSGEAQVAGAFADGMMTTSGLGLQQQTEVIVPTARAAGRNRSLDLVLEVKLSYDENPRRAARGAKRWAPSGVLDDPSAPPALIETTRGAIEGDLATEWLVASSPDQVVPVLRQYEALGFGHLVLTGPGNNQERFLHDVASDLLPLLRGTDGGRAVAG